MTQEERNELKIRIKENIEKTEKELVYLEDATKPITPENSLGRVSRMDAINNKSVSEVALRSSKRKLNNLNLALHHADNPDFGICSNCKRPIQAARLMFMPQSTRCVKCADR
jgi:DnaK suppressor protein